MNEWIRAINLDFVNAYLIKMHDGFVLIDTGMIFHAQRLEEELTGRGCVPGKLKLVVITHGDIDHIGNCAMLQEKFKAPVAMHEADAFMGKKVTFLNRKSRNLRAAIHIFLARLRRRKMPFAEFKPDILLKDGQDLKKYGLDARVLHLPGHTKGSIGVLTEEGDLFCGDTFVNQKDPDIAVYVDNFPQLENSIRTLKKLNVKKVYPGHGKTFLFSDLNHKI